MAKEKISIYCKKIRKESGLNSQTFASFHGVSREYVSKIENGYLDDKHSYAQIQKLIKTYGLSIDDLEEIDVDNTVLEAINMNASVTRRYSTADFTYAYNKYTESNLERLKKYLIEEGYEVDDSDDKKNYDLEGINPYGDRFVCNLIQSFSTGISDKTKSKCIFNCILNFIQTILTYEVFTNEKPLELILFTPSINTYNLLVNYAKKHFPYSLETFFRLEIVWISKNQKSKEYTITYVEKGRKMFWDKKSYF